jgi:hypothetical protein
MPIIKDGTTLKAINFNGTSIKKVIYNGTVVFTSNITVDWSIYVDSSTDIDVTLSASIVDSEPLSSSDTITVRLKDMSYSGGIMQVNLTTANPSRTLQANAYNITTTIEFLVNGVVKANDTWTPPSFSGGDSGSVTFEP